MTIDEEKASASRELEWLLSSLDETISALRSGLEECLSLLNPNGPGSTLALSTLRSEALKGIITRVGSRVTRGDMRVKMFGLPHTKGFQAYKLTLAAPTPNHTLILEQLVDVNNYVIESLELLQLHAYFVASMDPKSVMEKLCSLESNVVAARTALKGASLHRLFPFHAADPKVFDPPLPSSVAFDLYISEAAIIAELRTLNSLASSEADKPSFLSLDTISPFGFRERFAAAVGIHHGTEKHTHGVEINPDEVFIYNGMEVKVKELVRVESQDPSLMAAWAKLGGLEHVLRKTIKSLRFVMTAAGIE
ncbi:RAVE subunit 2/Rogdi [Trichophaea hybrida]|nr:RAVE subunit 2/Rogdi [Trichophaea hybrida]